VEDGKYVFVTCWKDFYRLDILAVPPILPCSPSGVEILAYLPENPDIWRWNDMKSHTAQLHTKPNVA
jgi:hypothetical protein